MVGSHKKSGVEKDCLGRRKRGGGTSLIRPGPLFYTPSIVFFDDYGSISCNDDQTCRTRLMWLVS